MLQFQGFKPGALGRMAKTMGYSGDMGEFDKFLSDNPDKQDMMNVYSDKAKEMMMGGYVKGYANGGLIDPRYQRPVQRNPNVLAGYYDSPEFQYFNQNVAGGIGTMYMRTSPYFGEQGSGTIGGAEDRSYIDYLNRTGQTSYLQGGTDFTQAPPQVLPEFKGGPENDQRANAPTATAPPVGPVDYTQGPVPQSTGYQGGTIAEAISNRAFNPAMPYGTTVQPVGTAYDANQAVDTTLGQVSGTIAPTAASATATQATGTTAAPATTMAAETAANEIGIATDTLTAAQGAVDPRAVVAAQSTVDTGVSTLDAVQGTSILMSNPNQRKVQTGELVSGAANAQTASTFTEQVQAAEATPTNKATIQGQLEGLMASFEGGNTPAWAAGAMRNVSTQMANRGLGASSMAAQALIQGAMESALPIAQADASIIAQFEAQNLSNRQQRAMLGAQQRAAFMGQEFDQAFQSRVQNASRVSEIANMNFTADQQIALENSRTSNTMNLANLSNRQAMVMAQAASISGLEMANLSNQQQAAVQNAQAFLQMDLTNLTNSQQTELFKAQAIQQALLTDNASQNAAKQFNATSENQTNQFMSSLNAQVTQFNATQQNAMTQFREGETNAASKFNASMREQRSQFNATNSLVIAQANAQWRQNATTINTAAQNTANMEFAKQVNGLTNKSIDEVWQRERDMMDMYFNSEEKKKDRVLSLILGDKSLEAAKLAADAKVETSEGAAKTDLLFKLFWPF